jgi:hypothetical protein
MDAATAGDMPGRWSSYVPRDELRHRERQQRAKEWECSECGEKRSHFKSAQKAPRGARCDTCGHNDWEHSSWSMDARSYAPTPCRACQRQGVKKPCKAFVFLPLPRDAAQVVCSTWCKRRRKSRLQKARRYAPKLGRPWEEIAEGMRLAGLKQRKQAREGGAGTAKKQPTKAGTAKKQPTKASTAKKRPQREAAWIRRPTGTGATTRARGRA